MESALVDMLEQIPNKFPKWWQRPGTLARRGGRPIPLGLGLLTQQRQRSKKVVGPLLPTLRASLS
jgi:hypothetical protein